MYPNLEIENGVIESQNLSTANSSEEKPLFFEFLNLETNLETNNEDMLIEYEQHLLKIAISSKYDHKQSKKWFDFWSTLSVELRLKIIDK